MKSPSVHLHHPPTPYHDFFPPLPSPTPSPPPLLLSDFFPSIPVAKSSFDLITIVFIAGLLLLSLLSLTFIFYLRLKSRRLQHLENFNSLWTIRLLLVLLSAAWAFNEILRLPLVRRKYLFPLLSSISLQKEADICKIHVVLSLGLLEPSFLVTLLFLVNVSIKKKNPSRMWELASLFLVCSPMTVLQVVFLYSSPLSVQMPRFMRGSSIPGLDGFGNLTMLCTYPFLSCVLFAGFAAVYAVVLLISCWRVMALVINKGMRRRIGSLAAAVMVGLSAQISCLCISWLWLPKDSAYGFVLLAMFLFVLGSMATGEVILVIKPITDALAAGADRLAAG